MLLAAEASLCMLNSNSCLSVRSSEFDATRHGSDAVCVHAIALEVACDPHDFVQL